jgi:hypothetical protein
VYNGPAGTRHHSGVQQVSVSPLRQLLTSLGGADPQILARAPADAKEMTGRGIAAIIPALFGAAAVIIAFGYAFSVPLPVAAVAGLVWGAIILCFDVSLMSASPDRKFWAKVTTFGLRAIIAILAALTFASAIVILIFAKDINIQVARDQQNGLINYRTQVITPKYAAKITADNKAITGYQAQISQADQAATQAAQEVQAAQVAATCEEKGVSQYSSCPSGTGKYGQGPVYAVRLTELHNAQANLAAAKQNDAAVKQRVGPQLRAAQQDLATQQAGQWADYASAQHRYAHDDGLIARWSALNELEGRSLTVRAEVLLLEALIVAVDLSAVIVKLASKTETYDNIVALERDMAQQEATDEKSKLEEDIDRRETTRQADTSMLGIQLDAEEARARDYAAAWLQIQRHQLRKWVEQETGEPWDGGVTAPFHPDSDSLHQPSRTHKRPREQGPIVEGRDSRTFTAEARDHERMRVVVSPPATRLAWLGTALITALSVVLLMLRLEHSAVTADWLAGLVMIGVAGLAIYTRGFRSAPPWAQRASFAVGLLGLALPVVIVLANVL